MIPESVQTLDLFKDTVKHLFELKYFLILTSNLLKREVSKINLTNKLTSIARNRSYINNNNEFPYVFIPQTIQQANALFHNSGHTINIFVRKVIAIACTIYMFIYVNVIIK